MTTAPVPQLSAKREELVEGHGAAEVVVADADFGGGTVQGGDGGMTPIRVTDLLREIADQVLCVGTKELRRLSKQGIVQRSNPETDGIGANQMVLERIAIAVDVVTDAGNDGCGDDLGEILQL